MVENVGNDNSESIWDQVDPYEERPPPPDELRGMKLALAGFVVLVVVAAGGWWSLPAPLLMTFLLLRVSGVTLLEHDISDRRAAYRDYVKHTNAFIPGPRKAAAVTGGSRVQV